MAEHLQYRRQVRPFLHTNFDTFQVQVFLYRTCDLSCGVCETWARSCVRHWLSLLAYAHIVARMPRLCIVCTAADLSVLHWCVLSQKQLCVHMQADLINGVHKTWLMFHRYHRRCSDWPVSSFSSRTADLDASSPSSMRPAGTCRASYSGQDSAVLWLQMHMCFCMASKLAKNAFGLHKFDEVICSSSCDVLYLNYNSILWWPILCLQNDLHRFRLWSDLRTNMACVSDMRDSGTDLNASKRQGCAWAPLL